MLSTKPNRLLIPLACLLLVMASCAGGDEGAAEGGEELATITVGRATTASSVPIVLGLKHGFFKEEGLKIEVEDSPTGATGVTQLMNEEVTVVLGGLSGPIAAVSKGIQIEFVSGAVADHSVNGEGQYQTLVRPDSGIESFSDLEGRTVGVNSVECCWEFWTREAVEDDGGNPSEVSVTQIPFSNQLTALQEGRVEAVTTLQPFATQMQEEGFVSLGNTAAIAHNDPRNGNTNYFMKSEFVGNNPEAVKAWQRALKRASGYANNHLGETRKAIVEITGQDPDLIKRAPLPLYVARIDPDTIKREARFLVKYGVLEEAPPYKDLVWEGAQTR